MLHISRIKIMAKQLDKANNKKFRRIVRISVFFQLYNIYIDDTMDTPRTNRVLVVLDFQILSREKCLS